MHHKMHVKSFVLAHGQIQHSILPFYHIFYLRAAGSFIGGKRFISLPIERIGSEQTEALLGVFTMIRVVGPAQQPEKKRDD